MPVNRPLTLLKIRPDEARMAFLVALFFAVIKLGRGMGGSAADALFFLRFGVEFLPYLFIALGITTFVVSLSYAAFLGRVVKRRFFTLLLLTMALILLAERAAILLNVRALYPVLWLSVNLIGSLLGTLDSVGFLVKVGRCSTQPSDFRHQVGQAALTMRHNINDVPEFSSFPTESPSPGIPPKSAILARPNDCFRSLSAQAFWAACWAA